MTKRSVVVFSDAHIEGAMLGYLSELLERTEVLSPAWSTPEAIEEAKAEAVVWVARRRPVSETDLEAMPKLRLLSTWGVGYNHIDVTAATVHRVPVCINPVFLRSIAEAALTLVLALSKRLTHLVRDARAGHRPLESERGVEIQGKALGVIGYGRIGRDVGELAHCLGMDVLAHDPYLQPDDFPACCRPPTSSSFLRR
jgi:D-3-phosphoglycerate dehydrogenase